MKFEHTARLAAPPDRVFPLLLDVRRVARCVPGVETVEATDGERYAGKLRVQVGPIRLALAGQVSIVEVDRAARRATMRAEADDKGVGGGVRALMTLAVGAADGGSEVRITSDVQILGRLGELGQPIMKRKADQIMRAFARNLAMEVAS